MYIIIDLETSTSTSYKRKANPLYNNEIVAIGYSTNKRTWSEYYTDKEFGLKYPKFYNDGHPDKMSHSVLVGHNLKFDSLYLWNNKQLQDWFKAGGKIWDTQLAHYILNGQQDKYPALRDIAVNKYGCKERTKEMEEYWEKGIDTKDIPRELVEMDVLQDVDDTKKIYLQQLELAENNGQLALIQAEMDSLLATTEMEYNGIEIDRQTFIYNSNQLQTELYYLKKELHAEIKKYWR